MPPVRFSAKAEKWTRRLPTLQHGTVGPPAESLVEVSRSFFVLFSDLVSHYLMQKIRTQRLPDIDVNAPLVAIGYDPWGFPRVGGDGCALKGIPRDGSMVKTLRREVWIRFGVQRVKCLGLLFSDTGTLGLALELRCHVCLGI